MRRASLPRTVKWRMSEPRKPPRPVTACSFPVCTSTRHSRESRDSTCPQCVRTPAPPCGHPCGGVLLRSPAHALFSSVSHGNPTTTDETNLSIIWPSEKHFADFIPLHIGWNRLNSPLISAGSIWLGSHMSIVAARRWVDIDDRFMRGKFEVAAS